MNMLKTTIIAGLLLIGSATAYAQPERGPENRRKNIEAQKIAFITTELSLSPEEAQVFWPVYNRAHEEQKELRKKFKPERKKPKEGEPKKTIDTMTDKELEERLDQMIAYEQAELDLKKKHIGQYKEILPVKKVAQLFQAEKKFRRKLMSDIRGKERQPGGQGRPENRGPQRQ